MPLPISSSEFLGLLKLCKPPRSDFKRIGVAFSGGSDSFALLHLLKQVAQSSSPDQNSGLPNEIYAITIDHQLQTSSSEHTLQCAAFARMLAVPHKTMRINWGSGVFPSRPLSGEAFEDLARDCRYRLLFDAMTELGLNCLAMGHHLDDQIETMVMRYIWGTRGSGLAGMRPCRRWGMGSLNPPDLLHWFGLDGMMRWVIRPLLTVPKDRCIATCHREGLQYIEDKTNFLPSITIRNEIRASLHSVCQPLPRGIVSLLIACETMSNEKGEGETPIKSAIQTLAHRSIGSSSQDLLQRLTSLNLSTSRERDQQDSSAKEYLRIARVPSPTGTFCVDPTIKPPEDRESQRGILLRILRYVSPYPWGSPQAEAGRRTKRLERIRSEIWDGKSKTVTSLTIGGQVLWTFYPGGKLSHPCWMASRLPPSRGSVASMQLDLSDAILKSQALDELWDSRFRVRLRPDLVPKNFLTLLQKGAGQLCIVPHGKLCTPKLEWWGWEGKRTRPSIVGKEIDMQLEIPKNVIHTQWIRELEDL